MRKMTILFPVFPMGSRVEARLAYHRDGKIFSRKNFPRDNPRLAVGYLCDESGSMRDDAIEASIRTGIIIQDLCYRMELPCYVCGFTTSGFGLQIINYVDQDIDGRISTALPVCSLALVLRQDPR